jgi:hypothetical protein
MLNNYFNPTNSNQQEIYHPYPYNHIQNNNNQYEFRNTIIENYNPSEYDLQSINNEDLNSRRNIQNYDEEDIGHYSSSDDTFIQDQEVTIKQHNSDNNIVPESSSKPFYSCIFTSVSYEKQ